MKKDFVPYVESFELKELGFDDPCLCVYSYDKLLKNNMVSSPNGDRIEKDPHDNRLNAPLYQQVFRWFREKHNLVCEHQFDDGVISIYVGEMVYPDNNLDFYKTIEVGYDEYNKSYDEMEVVCLKRLIEIVKKKIK